MKNYSRAEVTQAFLEAGVRGGDTIYLSTQLFGLGMLEGARSAADLTSGFLAGVRDAVGADGTIVVPSFTQQVGRYGLPYVHEETATLTGLLGEHLRRLPDARRSLHPVFSVAAQGPQADWITAEVSPVAFGRDSAFDRLYRIGGKCVCAGFAYYSGHITALMHYVETSFAVPYYYNKLVAADVFAGGRPVERPFVINVKHLGIDCVFDYRRYIDALAAQGEIGSAALGGGTVYVVDTRRQIEIGFDLLKQDIHAFLAHPPRYVPGRIPLDGPPEPSAPKSGVNWTGFLIGAR
jgi:aminoglycoside 3-N-acetyltransferase